MRYYRYFLQTLLIILVLSTAAFAKEKKSRIQVIQQKAFVKWHRLELTTSFGLDMNEVLTRHYNLAVTGRFYITPSWAVRVDFFKYFGKYSSTAYSIGDDFQVFPERRIMDWYAGLGAEYTLLLGKFLAFESKPLWWDFHLFASLGVTRNTSNMYHVTPGIGAGFRFALLQWLSLNLEVGDFIFKEKYSKTSHIINNVQFLTGLSILIPFKYHYKYEK